MSNLRPHLSDASPEPVFERLPVRAVDVGGAPIQRVLPTRDRRSIGPWVFLDWVGPAESIDVGSHPHIGLCTLSWLLSGNLLHRDSLGSEQLVTPGQVSLMTAGRGICHTETSRSGPVRAVQLWLALPRSQQAGTPGYHHYEEVSSLDESGGHIAVIYGRYQGFHSPVRAVRPGVLLECRVAGSLDVSFEYPWEHGLFVLDGAVRVDGELLEEGQAVYLGQRGYGVQLQGEGTVLVLGGPALEHPYVLWWNLLAADGATIEAARQAWADDNGDFGAVPGADRVEAPSLPGGPR